MRVLKLRHDLNLPPEPVGADAGGDILGENLDDDAAVEKLFGRDEHPAHSCTAELALYGVGAGDFRVEDIPKISHDPKIYLSLAVIEPLGDHSPERSVLEILPEIFPRTSGISVVVVPADLVD